jgi:hypothetical protein
VLLLEQLGHAQDEERHGDVPDLEGRYGDEYPSQPAMKHGPDPDADGLVRSRVELRRRADGDDDRQGRQQARNHADEHRGANADRRDEADGEQRSADRAEVVGRALEAVCAPVRHRRDEVGQKRVPSRYPEPPGHPSRGAERSHLPADVARPISDVSTAVAV